MLWNMGQGDLHVMSLPLKTQEHLQYFYCSARLLAQECYVNEMMGRAPPFVMYMMSRLFAAKLKRLSLRPKIPKHNDRS